MAFQKGNVPRNKNWPSSQRPECSFDGCARPSHARGWCITHYRRWRVYGDPAVVHPVWNKGKKDLQAPWNKGLTAADDSRIVTGEICGRGSKGKPAWNKGLTKDDPRVASNDEKRCASRVYIRKWATAAERGRAWYYRNLDHARKLQRETIHRRRARKAAAFVENVKLDVLFERDRGICGICGCSVDRNEVSIDHVLPLSKGGKHSYGNTQIAHPKCNSRKGAKLGFVLREVSA